MKRCEVCGGPLQSTAVLGVCRRNADCLRISVQRHNFLKHRRRKACTPCQRCGADWIRRSRGEKLCLGCQEIAFWCSGVSPGTGHVADRKHRVDRPTCRSCRLLRHALRRAERLNLAFSLTWEYIESLYPETCPYLGISLIPGEGAQHAASPTLDRIVPAQGYVEGNVEVISYLANAMKNGATVDQMLTFAQAVIRRFGEVPRCR